ncbi:uncharacterized protein LOC143456413 [Clavelina lepadiformis]|uniref:Uncharacterized protein n=1 Tax=Clavelina lepadiformis TaxID=159417 RepID=A0ABP0H3M9_CLALP
MSLALPNAKGTKHGGKSFGKISRTRPATTGNVKNKKLSPEHNLTSSSSMKDIVTSDEVLLEEKQATIGRRKMISRPLDMTSSADAMDESRRKYSVTSMSPSKEFSTDDQQPSTSIKQKKASQNDSFVHYAALDSNINDWYKVVEQRKIIMPAPVLGISSSYLLPSQFLTSCTDGSVHTHNIKSGKVLNSLNIESWGNSRQKYQAFMTKDGSILTASGESVSLWSKKGKILQEYGRKVFKCCKNIDLHDDEIIAATDPDNNCAAIISLAGNLFHKLGSSGTGKGEFKCPTGVTILNNGDVVVADWSCRVQVFDRQGRFKFQFGSKGNRDGEFDLPYGVTHDSLDNIIIADWWNDRVSAFRSDGTFIKHLLTLNDEIKMPAYVCIPDRGNQLILSEFGNSSIKIFYF